MAIITEPAPPGIDLHAHTTASDGTVGPTELVERAARLGLSALAVTDHDTLSGLAEAAEAASQRGIDFVPGVELSVEDADGRFHLLGYLFDPENAPLNATLTTLRESRRERNQIIVEKARALGLGITWEDIAAEAGEDGEVIGRPHIAAALVKKGAVATRQEAFDKYLATGKPLYTPKDALSPAAAARLIHDAGGIAVMAHPGLFPWGVPDKVEPRLRALIAEDALDGLECYYSQHSPEDTRRYLEMAGRLGLLPTGGSDFHGEVKPTVPLGIVFEGGPAPASLLPPLRAAAGRRRE